MKGMSQEGFFISKSDFPLFGSEPFSERPRTPLGLDAGMSIYTQLLLEEKWQEKRKFEGISPFQQGF